MINKNFTLLLAGQFVSQIGDKFHMIALALWVLKTTGSSSKMAAVLAASIIPSIVLGLFCGPIIDRYNRKLIIVGTDLIRSVIIAVFAVLFYLGMMTFPLLLVMQVVLSINAAFFDPTIPSVIPNIVPAEKLAIANSKHQFINGFSTIGGAFLGGLFIASFGYIWVFIINAISFLVSAIFECFIDIPVQSKSEKKEHAAFEIFSDLKIGYQYMFSQSALMVLLFMVMIIHFFVGSIEVMMPVIASSISENGAKNLGFFQAAFGAGSIVMAILLGWLDISGKEKMTLFGGVFFIGLLYSSASLFHGTQTLLLFLFLGMIFLLGASVICASISFKTLLQKQIDNKFAGRVFAVAGSAGNASIPAAMMVYGFLLEKYAYQGLLMVSGLILMLLSCISLVLYKEKKDDQSDKIIETTT